VHYIHIQNPVLSRAEFVELLARRFGLSKDAAASKTTLLHELESLLLQARRMGETTLLVIDEGQSLPLELLEEIRLLANIETNNDRLLSVIIAGQPELADRLNDPRLRQFKQRIALRCQLRPLTLDEITTYVAGRISAAGGMGGQAFTREAVTEIHERSAGVPRTISVISDNALLAGFAAGVKPVTKAMVGDVCRDLDLPEPGHDWAAPAGRVNGHASVHPGPASFQSLRARVSLPREGEDTGTQGKPGSMFGIVTRKRRRFFFFGSR
jgi:general secretion pathway protein A